MSINGTESIVVCPASEVCTNMGCKSEIVAISLGELGTKLAVVCDQNYGHAKLSEIESYDAVAVATDYAAGDDVANIYVLMDAPVCSNNGQQEISNPNILYNGQSASL